MGNSFGMFTIQTQPLYLDDTEDKTEKRLRKLIKCDHVKKLLVPKRYRNTPRPHPDQDIQDSIIKQ